MHWPIDKQTNKQNKQSGHHHVAKIKNKTKQAEERRQTEQKKERKKERNRKPKTRQNKQKRTNSSA